MANTFELAQNYLPMLDEVYKATSRTSILDATQIEIVNGNTVKVYKTSMDGLGDYSRNNGFTNGDVNGVWETLTLTKDRGRSFQVDTMDNEETMDMAFGTLVSEFIRTKVSPEIDAYTFAKLAGTPDILKAADADVVMGTTDVAAMIDDAERQMNEAEVPTEGRILFVSESAYSGLKSKITRTITNGEANLNNGILMYNDMRIVRVPQTRFYTAITLRDGKTTGQTEGGFVGTSGTGKPINFMIVHPSALTKVTKHVLPRIFAPGQNINADAWKFDYRVYHDTFVFDNKVKGIYLSAGATALA